MGRTARLLAGTGLAVVAAGFAAAPAYAGDTGAGAGSGAGTLVMAPATVVPGGGVTATTTGCGKKAAASGNAGAVGAGTFPMAPGDDTTEAVGRFRVPESAQPGTYEIVARCAEGDRQVTGDLVVALSAAREEVQPRGSLKTGVGGGLGRDPVQTTAGVAALAVAAAGGTWLLHRRARGDGI